MTAAIFGAFFALAALGTNELASVTTPSAYRAKNGGELKYRIYVPAIPDTATNGVPLVVFLHGSGECGTNNLNQLVNGVGALVAWSKKRCPAIVVAPQCPMGSVWSPVFFNPLNARMPYKTPPMIQLVSEMIDSIVADYPVNTNRLLLTGLSLGGYGVWDMLARYPGRFAAGMPICGGGDPAHADEISLTPVWTFHGERDGNVPTKLDRAMVSGLWNTDAFIRYTEYPDLGHAVWAKAYGDEYVMKWFFSQERKGKGK